MLSFSSFRKHNTLRMQSVKFGVRDHIDKNIPRSVLPAIEPKNVAKGVWRPEIQKPQFARPAGNFSSSSWAPASSRKHNIAARDENREHITQSGTAPIHLTRPMYYVRYRTPRVVTDRKRSMMENQDTYKSQFRSDPVSLGTGEIKTKRKSPFVDVSSSIKEINRKRSATKKSSSDDNSQNRKTGSSAKEGRNRLSKQIRRREETDEDDISSYDIEDDHENEIETEMEEAFSESITLDDIGNAEILQFLNDELGTEDIVKILLVQYGIRATFKQVKTRIAELKGSDRRRTGKTRRERRKKIASKFESEDAQSKVVKLSANPLISVKDLAELMNVGAGELLKYLMINEGILININQCIPRETAEKALVAFGKVVEELDELEAIEKEMQALEEGDNTDPVSNSVAQPRSPVVTIMGHVDHGKTSLLDKIRNTNVARNEAGGITQAISAFKVQVDSPDDVEIDSTKREITFIDTPGHAAFSEMRNRGAKLTDILVLVIAADDGIMEQTRECLNAAKIAQCPIVVAINKIDKVGANVNRVKQDLINEGILIEEFGGDVQVAEVSAKTGQGIEDLLEKILLQSDVMSLSAKTEGGVEGVVIEGTVDKGLGVVVTALVQQGTVKVGQTLVCGTAFGKVRLLLNDQGKSVMQALPSTPIRIVGMNRVPFAGDSIVQADNDNLAREMSESRLRFTKDQSFSVSAASVKEQTMARVMNGTVDAREIKKIPVVVKADVVGSLEALISSMSTIMVEDESTLCKIDVVFSGVGDVTTSDVAIASSSKARVIAFNVASTMSAHERTRSQNVEVKYYNVLYDALDEMRHIVESTVTPPPPGEILGKALIKKLFTIGRTGKIAGCVVESGKVVRHAQVRVLRGKTPIFTGMLSTLKVIKDDKLEVGEGQECGLTVKGFEDFTGDRKSVV